MLDNLLSILLGYGLGSLPLGHWLARWIRGVDLRVSGSGNVGATNAYRTAGLLTGLAVMVLDIAKGAGSVLLAARVAGGGAAPVAAGVAAVLGHAFPVWLNFRGGKGVATAAGAFSIVAPLATLIAISGFTIIVWATRYVSLGSVIATASLPALAWITDASVSVIVGCLLAASLIIARHRANLKRLHAGTERRLGGRP